MPKTFSEKIFSSHAGHDVKTGEIVMLAPDIALSHDNTAAIIGTFEKMGGGKVDDPTRHVIVLDHCVPAADAKYAANHKKIREFVEAQGIPYFYDINRGICHQVLPEEGFAVPGFLILGSDSHTTTHGAFGAFAAGIGRSELACIMAIGKLWLRCPETIQIAINGSLPKHVGAKDVSLSILRKIGADGALYKAVEFMGDVVREMTVGDRMTLCNLAAEMGAKNGYVIPNSEVIEWLIDRTEFTFDIVESDEDANYEQKLDFDVTNLAPQVSKPHTVDNVADVTEVAGTKINQAILGTCTNGRIEDFHAAVDILGGYAIHPNVRLLVFPASQQVYEEGLIDGTWLQLSQAGAVIMNTGCGPCLGAHEGVLATGEVCISSANRNFKGRMGNPESEIYLASPQTVMASAIAGEIRDPRSF
jgi:3-isopropylmalate/(R)-2-methylmalate dehydratase large subunit